MRYINELREGEMISQVFLCKNKQTLQTKAGKNYYSVQLQDKTGTLDGKVWDLNNGIGHFEPMDYIYVDGQIVVFQNNFQLNIKRVRKAQEGEYLVDDFMPVSGKSRDDMYRELIQIIDTIKNPYYKRLLEIYFKEDKEFIKKFVNHSAAKSVHHGFIGGLLEHTLSVTKLCDFYTTQYPVLNRDLLLTAAMFHDVAKIDELSAFPENDYTDQGQLLGHIVMGAMMIDRTIQTIDGFPVKLATELEHCILAHHGELEFGSPKKPSLVEAVALSFADNTDAKMETFKELLVGHEESTEWLGFNRLLDANVRPTSK